MGFYDGEHVKITTCTMKGIWDYPSDVHFSAKIDRSFTHGGYAYTLLVVRAERCSRVPNMAYIKRCEFKFYPFFDKVYSKYDTVDYLTDKYLEEIMNEIRDYRSDAFGKLVFDVITEYCFQKASTAFENVIMPRSVRGCDLCKKVNPELPKVIHDESLIRMSHYCDFNGNLSEYDANDQFGFYRDHHVIDDYYDFEY